MVDTGLVMFGLIGLTSGSLLQVSVLVFCSARLIVNVMSRQIIASCCLDILSLQFLLSDCLSDLEGMIVLPVLMVLM